jgi:hypothetical protein
MNAPSSIAMAGRIPPAPVLAILSRYKREDIEAFIAVAIDLLDLADGDPDVEGIDDDAEPVDDDTELNGDERDTGNAEDECLAGSFLHEGPGCPIGDPGGGADAEVGI